MIDIKAQIAALWSEGPIPGRSRLKHVLLGTLSPEWASRHAVRVHSSNERLEQLGVQLEAVYYTQGRFDFVDIVDAPEPDALLTFSLWYVSQGYGRVESMPAFDVETLAGAAGKL